MRLVGVLWIKLAEPGAIVRCPFIKVLLRTARKGSYAESFPQRIEFVLQRFRDVSLRQCANVGLNKCLAKKTHHEGRGVGQQQFPARMIFP